MHTLSVSTHRETWSPPVTALLCQRMSKWRQLKISRKQETSGWNLAKRDFGKGKKFTFKKDDMTLVKKNPKESLFLLL